MRSKWLRHVSVFVCAAGLLTLVSSLSLVSGATGDEAAKKTKDKSAGDSTKQTGLTKAKKRGGITLGEALVASQKKHVNVALYPPTVPPGGKAFLQRTMFDFGRTAKSIQIALVVDATDSMGQDLTSVKENLKSFVGEIQQQQQDLQPLTKVAVVVYRDIGCRSGAVQVLTRDRAGKPSFLASSNRALSSAIASIGTEPGEPEFPEQVDRGLYTALSDLEWDQGPDVTRLIILAGDAPPFSEEFLNQPDKTYKNEPLRSHSVDELVGIAAQKQIKIFAVLCSSGFADTANERLQTNFDKYRPEMLAFLDRLAVGTGGQVFDLSDPSLIEKLKNTETEIGKLRELKKIEAAELQSRRDQTKVRIAVLPQMPSGEMKWSGAPFVFASAVVLRLEEGDGRGVVKMRRLKEEYEELAGRARPGANLIQELASEQGLNLNYVLCVDYGAAQGSHKVRLRAFDRNGAELAATNPLEGESPLRLVTPALAQLSQALQDGAADERGKVLSSFLTRSENPHTSQDDVLKAYSRMELAAEFDTTNDEGRRLNQEAKELLEKSLTVKPGDPFALLLLSNCEQNLGNLEQAKARLQKAYDAREQAADENLKLEIEADYKLVFENDPFGAIALYEQLAERAKNDNRDFGKQALRTKWMLSGLYLGDWGAAADARHQKDLVAYLDKARDSILDILIYWPDSPEARYYEQYVDPKLPKKPWKEGGNLVSMGLVLPVSDGADSARVPKIFNAQR